jgi:putative ABC transport system permease protein
MTDYQLFLLLDEGLIFGLIALGIYVSFFWLRFPDLTPDGSFVFGAVIYARVVHSGFTPALGILSALIAGALAGSCTALLNRVTKIPAVVAGLVVSTALYSANWLILGKPNQFVDPSHTLVGNVVGAVGARRLLLWLLAVWIIAAVSIVRLSLSIWGLRLRAIGENAILGRDLGLSETAYTFCGLAVANSIVALSGALFVERSFSADINMGIGTTIAGLAALILGLAIASTQRKIWLVVVSILLGALVYKTVVFLSLQLGIPPEAFRMVSSAVLIATFVLISTKTLDILKGLKWS